MGNFCDGPGTRARPPERSPPTPCAWAWRPRRTPGPTPASWWPRLPATPSRCAPPVGASSDRPARSPSPSSTRCAPPPSSCSTRRWRWLRIGRTRWPAEAGRTRSGQSLPHSPRSYALSFFLTMTKATTHRMAMPKNRTMPMNMGAILADRAARWPRSRPGGALSP